MKGILLWMVRHNNVNGEVINGHMRGNKGMRPLAYEHLINDLGRILTWFLNKFWNIFYFGTLR